MLEWLLTDSLLDARSVVRVTALSILLVLASGLVFRRNPVTRRSFMLIGLVVLMVLPWATTATWILPIAQVPDWSVDARLPMWIALVWLTGSLWFSALTLARFFGARRRLAALSPFRAAAVRRQLQILCSRLDLKMTPTLKCGDQASASTLGASLIILPAQASAWSTDTLQAVLAHELVHIKRRDDRWMLLTALVSDLYWWLPWMRLLYGRFVTAMEHSCDDAASELCATDAHYLGGVVDVAKASSARLRTRQARLRVIAGISGGHLIQRVERFAQPRVLQTNIQASFWLLVVPVSLVLVFSSVEPVQRVEPSAGAALGAIAPLAITRPDGARYASVWSGHRSKDLAPLPRLNRETTPVYPGNALRHGIEGDVWVTYLIVADGSVVRARVLRSEPAAVFDRAAMTATLARHYVPARGHAPARGYAPGVPNIVVASPVWVTGHYQFRLETRSGIEHTGPAPRSYP